MALLTKKDIVSLFWRGYFIQHSFNYSRMQGLGFMWAMKNALRKIHQNEEDYRASIKRHSEFFNTHVQLPLGIMGIVCAMEEHKESPDAIRAFKVSIMGPIAAIGDAVMLNYYAVTRGIVGGLAVGAGLAVSEASIPGAYSALVLAFFFPNILRLVPWFLLKDLYDTGSKALDKLQTQMKHINQVATYIGLMAIGGLTASFVRFYLKPIYKIGERQFIPQIDILDKIQPSVLSIGAVLTLFWFIRVKKLNIQWLIWGVIAFSILTSWLGLFSVDMPIPPAGQ